MQTGAKITEKDFVESIRKKRTDAINKSDRDYSNAFLVGGREMGPGFIALILILLICSIGLFAATFKLVSKDKIILHEKTIEKIIEKPIIQQNINITKIEHIIKGNKIMTCLNQPNSKEVVCYKET